ncbi:hypothetical protein J6590_061114 [Homalodisca vitripennis]|nr:hypothetical protein J6590_061114 [Homalodisca vitripennis]
MFQERLNRPLHQIVTVESFKVDSGQQHNTAWHELRPAFEIRTPVLLASVRRPVQNNHKARGGASLIELTLHKVLGWTRHGPNCHHPCTWLTLHCITYMNDFRRPECRNFAPLLPPTVRKDESRSNISHWTILIVLTICRRSWKGTNGTIGQNTFCGAGRESNPIPIPTASCRDEPRRYILGRQVQFGEKGEFESGQPGLTLPVTWFYKGGLCLYYTSITFLVYHEIHKAVLTDRGPESSAALRRHPTCRTSPPACLSCTRDPAGQMSTFLPNVYNRAPTLHNSGWIIFRLQANSVNRKIRKCSLPSSEKDTKKRQ